MEKVDLINELWKVRRSSADDLRNMGLTVAIHNDYLQNGTKCTFWLFTVNHNGSLLAIKGEARTDEEALDEVRAKWAKLTDARHHAPKCPANHYHGTIAPTGRCSCGATL